MSGPPGASRGGRPRVARGIAASLRAASLATAVACISASCGGTDAGTAPLPGSVAVGQRFEGTHRYVEYLAGDLPLIFAAPHGGMLSPTEIPARSESRCGAGTVTVRDLNTAELAIAVQQAFLLRTGHAPHVVINRLHRDRMDANRPVAEGACGNGAAEVAWREYHAFVDAAKARVLATRGAGFFTDLHGHGHAIQRLELGYGLCRWKRTSPACATPPRTVSASRRRW